MGRFFFFAPFGTLRQEMECWALPRSGGWCLSVGASDGVVVLNYAAAYVVDDDDAIGRECVLVTSSQGVDCAPDIAFACWAVWNEGARVSCIGDLDSRLAGPGLDAGMSPRQLCRRRTVCRPDGKEAARGGRPGIEAAQPSTTRWRQWAGWRWQGAHRHGRVACLVTAMACRFSERHSLPCLPRCSRAWTSRLPRVEVSPRRRASSRGRAP
jgi:hypothetical protein